MTEQWLHAPVGLNAQRWVTRGGCRTVLVIVHSVACAQRLMDPVGLLGDDTRIQVVYTIAPSIFCRGVAERLRAMDCVVIPWGQAEQTPFDLVIAASYWGIERVHGPLVLLPHGAGYGKFMTPTLTGAAPAPRSTFGLDRQRLVHDGRVIPSVLVLAHEEERRRLAATCPEALSQAVVVGDPVADRLREGLSHRGEARRGLGVDEDQRLVVVASTWGRQALLGARLDVLSRVSQEALESGWRVALLTHPNVYATHGGWQVRSWLAHLRELGLLVVPTDVDFTAVLAAADAVVSDHGSTTLYATLLDRPIMVCPDGGIDVDPGSPIGAVLAQAPHIGESGPVLSQVESLLDTWTASTWEPVAARISSHPGEFAARMRHTLYEQLFLREPPWEARLPRDPFSLTDQGRGGERRD
ncbi:hypothetical protein J4H86_24550 [Spiractinospora alimapuensis]|uniref:hypothetical protein n=1 Tax=Spiractinospora alimapuensis TaxID=2820884 RepID=UPI001F32F733|nr:hypothetical protein [Spiractinospora alimapuensis]QVQ51889.1 hypothetical protein J4H86_24550 [Spiractinospora alimapuensis]